MVSPYLQRRIRTLEEVAKTRKKSNPLDAVVKRAMALEPCYRLEL